MGHYFLSLSYIHLYPQIHSCLNLDVSCNLPYRGRHTTSASKLAWIAPTCHHYHRLDFCCRFKVFCEGKKWLFSFSFFRCTCREGQKFSFCHSIDGHFMRWTAPYELVTSQILKERFVSSGAQVCANERSWTTTMPELPSPSDYFLVGAFFFQWEAGAKMADTCCLAGKTLSVSAEATLYPTFVCFGSKYCHKRQWSCHCTLGAPPKKLLLSLLWSRFWSECVQSPQ